MNDASIVGHTTLYDRGDQGLRLIDPVDPEVHCMQIQNPLAVELTACTLSMLSAQLLHRTV